MTDWDDRRYRFQLTCMLLDSFQVPSRAALEKHAAHLLTGGQVGTLFTEASQYTDLLLYPGGSEWMEQAWSLEDEIRKSRKRHDHEVLPYPYNWREVIRRAGSFETETNAFRCAYTYMDALFARMEQLQAQNEAAFKRFKTGAAAFSATSDLARQCWFAQWLHKRGAIEDDRRRQLAQQDFHGFCIDIYKGMYSLPIKNKIYNRSWFGKLLDTKRIRGECEARDEDIYLRPSIWRLKSRQLHALVAHPYLKPDVLPPLDTADFPHLSTEP
ncbi:hypothetical protein ACRAWG_07205 [Methylobacterium sp. P31]